MKKTILLITCIAMLSATAFTQSFTVYPSPASVSGLPSEFYIEAIAHVENNTSTDLTLRWERVVNNLPTDWDSSVCDNSQCYVPQVYLMDFTIDAGDESILDVRFYPAGIEGNGSVELLVYDPLDSLNTVVSNIYYGEATLTTDVEDPIQEDFKIYPNPGSHYIVLPESNHADKAVLYNIAGQKIQTYDMQPNEQRIDVSHLTQGLYLVQFIASNGAKLHTTRLTKR